MPSDVVTSIGELLSDLTQLRWTAEPEIGMRADWIPVSAQGRALLCQLTAPENRATLRAWCARFRGVQINATAANVLASLERAIGEKLLQ